MGLITFSSCIIAKTSVIHSICVLILFSPVFFSSLSLSINKSWLWLELKPFYFMDCLWSLYISIEISAPEFMADLVRVFFSISVFLSLCRRFKIDHRYKSVYQFNVILRLIMKDKIERSKWICAIDKLFSCNIQIVHRMFQYN